MNLLAAKNQFQELLDRQRASQAVDGALQKAKARAWEQFLHIGLPESPKGTYQYLKLRNLFSQKPLLAAKKEIPLDKIRAHIVPECQDSYIVIVNGHYQSHLSSVKALPKQLVICPFADALKTYSGFLNNQWIKASKEEIDPFAALNAALHTEGLFFYVPPKLVVEQPIQILYIIDADEQELLIVPKIHLFAGASSQISLVTSQHHLSGDRYCVNQTTDLTIEENARVEMTQLANNLSPQGWHFDAVRASLKKNAHLKTVSLTTGAQTVRNDYRIALAGENAEASLNGIWMLKESSEAHTNVFIEHQAPHCRSLQLFKGALNDTSRSSFEGKIFVRQAAQKTEAFQLNNNLLLSEHAHADSKPNLEIFADDVKASHGATFGQLDQEQLFYMKTRGFPTEMAKTLLTYSFCKEVIDLVSLPSLHTFLSEQAKI